MCIKINNKKAFTLMEILVVVIIIGVMASWAIPQYGSVIERSRSGEGVQILSALLGSQNRFALENGGAFAANINNLDIDIPVPENFLAPNVFNNPAGVATIVRNDGTDDYYTLTIDSNGDVTCANAGAYVFCSKMGY